MRIGAELAAAAGQPSFIADWSTTAAAHFAAPGPDGGKPREIHVLRRGDVRTPGQARRPGTVPLIAGRRLAVRLAEDEPGRGSPCRAGPLDHGSAQSR